MSKIIVATFNCENLFRRFKFQGKPVKRDGKTVFVPWTPTELERIAKDGFEVDALKFDRLSGDMRALTAAAIAATDADVIALQEVEGLDTLKLFNSEYLTKSGYKYKLVIDANDPRFIDVAVLSRYPFASIVTHQFRRTANNRTYVFSRDCLEVLVQIAAGKQFHLLVNHFKSMIGGRAQTMSRRKLQSEEVVKILHERFGDQPGEHPWIIVGDLNDYAPSAGLKPLIEQPWLENVVQTRIADPDERWTHYWDGGDEYRQLDYILLSKSLADQNSNAVPIIERRGMPKRAARYTGERFEGVGLNKPKASDHCPVSIGLEI